MLPTSPQAAIRWLPLVNQSGATIPAFGCVRIVSTALDATGQLIYTVDQPNGDLSANYLFNGPSTVATGAAGSGTADFPCQAIWDTGTPSVGDSWGPKSGQWALSKNGSPEFPVVGIVDAGTNRMLIGPLSPALATIVKPAYDIAAISSDTPGSGSVEVYSFDGMTLSDTTNSITGYNLSTSTAKAGTYYEAIYIDGCAFIVNANESAIFEGTIYGAALAATDATGDVTPTTAIWGALPDPATYPITFQNDFGLQGPIGRKCLVARADSGTYYLIQIQPPIDVLFEGTLDTTLLSTDASATVVPTQAIYGGLPVGATISAANGFQAFGNHGDLVLVAADLSGNYFLIPTTTRPLPILFWTTLADDLVATVATADCDAGVTPIFGTMADASFTAANTLGLSGKTGSACLVAGDAQITDGVPDPKYYLLALPPGGGCTFTLTSAYTAGVAAATVGTPWGSAPDATGATITVNDPQGLFARAISGAVGEAVYDPVQGYVVVACDQETTMYAGTLNANLAAATASVNVISLAACDAKPFGQATSASYYVGYNTLKLSGKTGDPCYIQWNKTTGHWEITAIKGSSAGGCEFTLTSTFSSGSASATVTTVWGTTPDAAGAAITVKDLAGLYGPSVASAGVYAKGVAIYDPVGAQYVVTSCQMKCRFLFGSLTTALTAGGSVSCIINGGTDGIMPVTAGTNLTIYSNDNSFGGSLFATFLASYDPATDKYYFIWVSC